MFALIFLFLCAFLAWFFRPDLALLMRWAGKKMGLEQRQNSSQERISEEERQKLEEILKRR